MLFSIEEVGFRRIYRLFGLKVTLTPNIAKYMNTYISLGTNCFVRTKLAQCFVKPRKKQGELSFPFDVCITPVSSVNKILANDFCDYFDDLTMDNNGLWRNPKYGILYLHDEDITEKEAFIKRYSARIDNFRNIIKNAKFPVFITATCDDEFDPNLYNSIYESLKKYRSGKSFKYCVCPYKEKENLNILDTKQLNPEILYKEFEYPHEDYKNNWPKLEIEDNSPRILKSLNEFANTIAKAKLI